MQRGEVAVASAFTSPSNQFDQTQHMPQHWTPPPRAGVRPPSPPPDDHDRPRQSYRHSLSLPGAGRRNATGSGYNNKHRKPKHSQQSATPCTKLLSGYGCPYGDKCHFSHHLRAFYPGFFEYGPAGYDDSIWSATFAAPPRSRQSYTQRQMPGPGNPPMPKSDPARHSSTLRMPPQRDRASSFAGHKSHDNQTDGVSMSSSGKLMFKEAVLRQSKAKLAQISISTALSATQEKPAWAEVDGVDLPRTESIQPQQQQYYPLPATATQLLNSVCPPYSQYVTEEQFHSNISKQLEGFVDYIDTQLASQDMHQQQAIDSLQELVRSLWPDAMIDVYGSSYTRLALPPM
ncbi:uncharacterized protein IUM83_06885 [Phytophthora cinnamomi]|uniref:uncharacterized protein n=1 Tax=Phytophthora cinnamomi TaxID=4785 RepID=UPI003559E1E2|nr:hypothetical protein IUM83_06885 [Phytophthora cinnamomi]